MTQYELEANRIANSGRETGRSLWRAVNIPYIRSPIETFSAMMEIISDDVSNSNERDLFCAAAFEAIPESDLDPLSVAKFANECGEAYDYFIEQCQLDEPNQIGDYYNDVDRERY